MPEHCPASLVAQILAAELQAMPDATRQAYWYLFARVAVESGPFDLANDQLPEAGMRLVVRERATGRYLTADRPAHWSREDEERYVAEMRAKLIR